MLNRKTLTLAAGAALALAVYLWWLWQPERQVRLHQRNLLTAIGNRDWNDVAGLMADTYSDRWGHDKGFVLREARELFRQFLVVEVLGEASDVQLEELSGEVRNRLEIRGRGGPLAEFAKSRVNALETPWTFRWQRQGWKPWDWRLVRVDHPDLNVHAPQ